MIPNGLEELLVERIDVDDVALVRPRVDAHELDLGLGEPGPEVAHQVADRPHRVAVVAGFQALVRIQDTDKAHELVPARALRFDRGVISRGGLCRGLDAVPGRHACCSTNEPSSGSPESSHSSNPPA